MFGIALFSLLPLLCHASPSVNLNGTTIHGRLLEYSGQEVFRGIPYAEPPVGELRLRPPQAKGSHSSVAFNATEFGPSCIQPYAAPEERLSEDCLTLNIQRPPGTNESSAYPVMVWIHGGGFLFGRSSSSEFNATNLVSHSLSRGTPIVYVNLNYRLGPLGFPQGVEASQDGLLNLGLKDQMMAFQWIRDHISAFGGDPNKITLFGESAGAVSIAAHLVNPNLANLVSGAILHSGALPTTSGRSELRAADWQIFLKTIGCDGQSDQWGCLRSASSDSFLKATQATAALNDPLVFLPSIDGPGGVIPDYPSRLLANLNLAKIPLIAGLNLDEGSMFSPEYVNSTEGIRNHLMKQYSASAIDTNALAEVMDQLLELYPDIPALGSPFNTGNETFSLDSQYKRMAALLGDLMFVAPVRLQNKAVARAGIPLYSYLFTQRQASTPPHLGVPHSANIQYVYGQLEAPVSVASSRLSRQMMDYWISFASSRHPNDGKGLPRTKWVPYTSKSAALLQLNGDDLRIIQDSYRAKQIEFIISSAPTLGL